MHKDSHEALNADRPPWQGPPVIDKFGLQHPPRWTVLEDGRVQIRVPDSPSLFHAGGRHYVILTHDELEAFITELEEARGDSHADLP